MLQSCTSFRSTPLIVAHCVSLRSACESNYGHACNETISHSHTSVVKGKNCYACTVFVAPYSLSHRRS
eukprot:m.32019 g.32019  ORF g.32019 m.32019 type:complete len:68 (+) comp9483_c0_seq2:118-321(+)